MNKLECLYLLSILSQFIAGGIHTLSRVECLLLISFLSLVKDVGYLQY
jgi:hypothetical protein